MSHTRFAIGFTRHRKVFALSDAAFRLWVSAMDHAREQGRDGAIEALDLDIIPHVPPKGRKRDEVVRELVAVGLWEPKGKGWQIHDYLDWQDSSSKVREKRERARERMRRVRANSERTFAVGSGEVRDDVPENGPPSSLISHPSSDPESPEGDARGNPDARGRFRMHTAWNPSDASRQAVLVAMVEPWAIPVFIGEFVGHFAESEDRATNPEWNRRWQKWATRGWFDPSKRPRRPLGEAEAEAAKAELEAANANAKRSWERRRQAEQDAAAKARGPSPAPVSAPSLEALTQLVGAIGAPVKSGAA